MKNKARGTWGVRVLIWLCTAVLGVLFFWLLDFVVEDIEAIKGPELSQIERQYVDAKLLEKERVLKSQVADLERQISNTSEQQRLVGDSSQNLQRTINQLLELRKLSLQKDVALSDAEKNNLSLSLSHFLESQKTYQALNRSISELTAKKLRTQEDQRQIEQQIAEQKEPARREFSRLTESHRLRLAAYQLCILAPLALVAGLLLLGKRRSVYFPLFLAFGGAALLKVALVVHEYFPSRYAKYILMAVLLAVVGRFLVHLIGAVAFPKIEWLRRQYREAYERFLCGVCEYPIRTGPRKFLYWTRRTVHKVLPRGDSSSEAEPYTCPSCGTRLFEECPSCHRIRHSLLGHCEHCGTEKDVMAETGVPS
jgi:hypothetical protein